MNINEDFRAYLAQRGQELAATQTTQQTAYERQERLAAEGGDLFTGLFAQLDAGSDFASKPVPADPAESDFNRTFGL